MKFDDSEGPSRQLCSALCSQGSHDDFYTNMFVDANPSVPVRSGTRVQTKDWHISAFAITDILQNAYLVSKRNK